ncbi:Methylenetetrahydrofolate reductase [Candidatus Gugararchaeum adminiculabundum]|nr:Methylenetetrahydrofolate reductase [Candidatus Gugararchaeum adminiculabundum]
MSKLREKLQSSKFILTSEISPPRSASLEKFRAEARQCTADAINVTDYSGALQTMSGLGASIALMQEKKEPIYQVTVRDRNTLGLQGDLIAAGAFGIENILALTGDSPRIGDQKQAKPVYEITSVDLVKLCLLLNKGETLGGVKLKVPTKFCVGSALTPGHRDLKNEVSKMQKKIDAGTQFFQSQPLFSRGEIERFVSEYEKHSGESAKKMLKLSIIGVLPLHDLSVMPILKSLPCLFIPKELEERMSVAQKKGKLREEAKAHAIELVDAIKEIGFAGAHVLPMGDVRLFEEIKKEV